MGLECLLWEKSLGDGGQPVLAPLPVELLEVGQGVGKVLDAVVELLLQALPGNVVQKGRHVHVSMGHQDRQCVSALKFFLVNPGQE